MYYVRKKLEVSAAHNLKLDYESKCEGLHGHNWNIVICLKSEELDLSFSRKNDMDELIRKAEIQDKCMDTKWGRRRWDKLGDWD